MSQANNQGKSMEIMDVTQDEVTQELDKFDVATLIHGHTHRPQIEQRANNKVRIVLGDWDKDVWYLKVNEQGKCELNHYPLSQTPQI